MYVSRSVATWCVQIGPSAEGERMCGSCSPEPTFMSGSCSFWVWPLPLSLHFGGSAGCGWVGSWCLHHVVTTPVLLPFPVVLPGRQRQGPRCSCCPCVQVSAFWDCLQSVTCVSVVIREDTQLRGLGDLCCPEDFAAFPEGTQHWEREPEPDVTTVSAG